MLNEDTENHHQPLLSYATQNQNNRRPRFASTPEGNLLQPFQKYSTYTFCLKKVTEMISHL